MKRKVRVSSKEKDDKSEIKIPPSKEVIRGWYLEPPKNKYATIRIRNINGAIKSANEGLAKNSV